MNSEMGMAIFERTLIGCHTIDACPIHLHNEIQYALSRRHKLSWNAIKPKIL